MSSVNYSLKHKGVKLISSDEAWTKTKRGRRKLNSKYQFVGKIDARLPNLIISAAEGKPKYKGNTHDLCAPAKRQIVEHFFDTDGKRNRKTVAYFGIEKEKTKKGAKK